MLHEFVEMLQVVSDCRSETSYNRRLYQLSLIVTDVTNARKAQHKRQKFNSETLTDVCSISELPSPSTYVYNDPDSGIRETDDSGFDSAGFQTPDNYFAFMSPRASTIGEAARSPDALLPYLGNDARTTSQDEYFNFLATEFLKGFGVEES